MEHNRNVTAPEAATDEAASSFNARDGHVPAEPNGQEAVPFGKVTVSSDLTDFEPVPLRYRTDGLTPAKQREYVEALADTGVARQAAARIGVSEQAVNRVRRRADARAFDLACEAAQRHGARRLRSIAYERAIEGTVKRHYYHGELKSEELVFDNRLLIYLLGKAGHLLDPPPEAEAVAADWEPWMDAIERGLPPPLPPAEPEATFMTDDDTDEPGSAVWEEEDGTWWTFFPPPAGFEGEEQGRPDEITYVRTLSADEQAAIDAETAKAQAERQAREAAERDRLFGFEGGLRDAVFSYPREAELYETSTGGAWNRPYDED